MEKVMESHGIWRAQKNTNPVNYMCSVVLIITGKDLPVPISSRADKGWAVKRARPSKKV